ncbi:hypothetical protein PR048_011166 [Dryococelus australis]|uniref:Uncharacterized protein n=1 Tax=Dryococelus australis TaxID=614101 RepID=A0ABQ9HKT0_9NEOP|nr:hypothetical protein PR048_011166 [Dryococelus australis]
MGVAIFHSVKEAWREKVHGWRLHHLHSPTIQKHDFAPLLKEVLAETVTPQMLQNGLKKCGLVPWNPDAVDFSKLPSRVLITHPKASGTCSEELLMAHKDMEEEIGTKKLEAFKRSNGIREGSNQSNTKMPTEVVNGQEVTSESKENNGDLSPEVVNKQEVRCKNTANIEDLSPEEDKGQEVIGQEVWQRKRMKKEKIPSVATPKEWILYHEKKENLKKQEAVRKRERAEERKRKKEQKRNF